MTYRPLVLSSRRKHLTHVVASFKTSQARDTRHTKLHFWILFSHVWHCSIVLHLRIPRYTVSVTLDCIRCQWSMYRGFRRLRSYCCIVIPCVALSTGLKMRRLYDTRSNIFEMTRIYDTTPRHLQTTEPWQYLENSLKSRVFKGNIWRGAKFYLKCPHCRFVLSRQCHFACRIKVISR